MKKKRKKKKKRGEIKPHQKKIKICINVPVQVPLHRNKIPL